MTRPHPLHGASRACCPLRVGHLTSYESTTSRVIGILSAPRRAKMTSSSNESLQGGCGILPHPVLDVGLRRQNFSVPRVLVETPVLLVHFSPFRCQLKTRNSILSYVFHPCRSARNHLSRYPGTVDRSFGPFLGRQIRVLDLRCFGTSR